MPPVMFPAPDQAGWLTQIAADLSGLGEAAAIEVLQADELLGIGLGSDILIVDDDPDNLTAYEAALSPLGRRVALVSSGVQALAKLLEQDFALLLLDVSMPGMTGLETARRIRQRARNRGLPIIFITGLTSSTDLVLEAYEVGAFDFVMKPIPPAVLRAKARVYLQLQERTYELLRESAQLRQAHKLLSEADDRLRERDTEARALRFAQEANRRKDELLATLSHELRNPLWTMTNALQLIRMRDIPFDREVAIFDRQVEHLTHIVGDLLDFVARSGEASSDATFTVRSTGGTATPAADTPPVASPSTATVHRILIVDDNTDAADMLAALLRMAGHQIAVAHDGPAALAITGDFTPNVALLDLGLPGMDGCELARRLRALEACRDTLLVAISGYAQPDDRERSSAAGFAHHLAKPVKLATIEALLAQVPGG